MNCTSDSCQQSRAACPVPQACHVALPERPRTFRPTYDVDGPHRRSSFLARMRAAFSSLFQR